MTLPKQLSYRKAFPLLLWDSLGVLAAFFIALAFRFDGRIPAQAWTFFVETISYIILLYILLNLAFGLYNHLWRYAGAHEVMTIITAAATGTLILLLVILSQEARHRLPLSVVLLGGLLVPGFFTALRYRQRLLTGVMARLQRLTGSPNRKRVLIVGAGESGQFVIRQFRASGQSHQYELVGFIDDDPAKLGLRVQGVPVLGDQHIIPKIVDQRGVSLIVIAMHNISGPALREILSRCLQTSARVKLSPNFLGSIDRLDGAMPLRDVMPADLLGRQPHQVDEAACRRLITDQVVLVTGAAGSIGSELCWQILNFRPRQLLLLDNNETGLHDLGVTLKRRLRACAETDPGSAASPKTNGRPAPETPAAERMVQLVADVTCPSRLEAIFAAYRPQLVFHAAAYKHVPLMEQHPAEAIRVNLLGTHLVATMAARYGADRFVLISSDKAVRPSSVMGATKRLGELIITTLGSNSSGPSRNGKSGSPPPDCQRPTTTDQRQTTNNQQPATKNSPDESTPQSSSLALQTFQQSNFQPSTPTRFTAVRFGNVLGSRGSVVPTFTRQIELGGPVTITHPEMTRYFMSIAEAVSLVIQAATLTEGGDLFMLDMGQEIRITDLAHKMIRLRGLRPGLDIPIHYTGIRPGEKLREELITADEQQQPTIYSKIFRIQSPAQPESTFPGRLAHLIQLANSQQYDKMVSLLWHLVGTDSHPVPSTQKFISYSKSPHSQV